MKTASDDLFRLIKSLNRSEKGYFKKFAGRNTAGEKNKYILLFDAVDSLESYDEKELKKKLKDEAFFKQLPVYKVYLFNLILESLQQYGTFRNSATKIAEMIAFARTLEAKALFKEALKYLRKAKELAYRYSLERYILEVLIMERNLMISMPDKQILENRKAVYDEQRELLDKLGKYFDYSWISDQMVIYVEHKGDFKDEQRKKDVKKIMASPYIKSMKMATDYTSKVYYYHTHLFYELSQQNIPEVHNILKREIELMEANRHLINENPKNYVSGLINFLLFSNILNKREDVRSSIVKLNQLRKRLKNKIPVELEIHINCHSAYVEMMIYTKNLDITRGKRTIRKIEDAIRNYGLDIPRQLKVTLLSQCAILLFIDGDIDNSLKWNNELIASTGPQFKSDIHYFSKIFQLLLHFELGNFDLLEYLVDSTHRYLKEKENLYPIEGAILKLMKMALRTEDHQKLHKEYEDVLFIIGKHRNDPTYGHVLSLFDFESWVKSKLAKTTMFDYLKRNTTAYRAL